MMLFSPVYPAGNAAIKTNDAKPQIPSCNRVGKRVYYAHGADISSSVAFGSLQAHIRTAGNFPAFLLYIGGTFAVGSLTVFYRGRRFLRSNNRQSHTVRGVTSLRVAIRGHSDCKGRPSFSRPFPVRRAVNQILKEIKEYHRILWRKN